jgi:hypothetical protein
MRAKFKYWRSKQHLKNVASLPCQHCGLEGKTQAAHSNMAQHGKGRGIKASDEFVAALCFACHHDLDAGYGLSKEEKQAMWWNAFRNTWLELLERNLVVTDLPIPKQEE